MSGPVDQYTLGHGLVGILLGMWRMPWYGALGISVAFELLENFALKPALPQMFPEGHRDTFANSTLDIVSWMAGYGFGRLIPGPTPKMWGARSLKGVPARASRPRRRGSRSGGSQDTEGMAERVPAPRRNAREAAQVSWRR